MCEAMQRIYAIAYTILYADYELTIPLQRELFTGADTSFSRTVVRFAYEPTANSSQLCVANMPEILPQTRAISIDHFDAV